MTCFGGRPPLFWRSIIHRATSSIPGQRYGTAGELAHAIRRLHPRLCRHADIMSRAAGRRQNALRRENPPRVGFVRRGACRFLYSPAQAILFNWTICLSNRIYEVD